MKLIKILFWQLVCMLSRNFVLFTIGQTTSTEVSRNVDAYYDGMLIEPLKTALVYGKYGQKRQVKENDTARFNKYALLGTQPVALVEGVTPSPQKLSRATINATVSLYGGYVELTEECDIYTIDPVVTIAQERVSWQAVQTIDEITRDVLVGGDNVFRAGGVATRVEVITKITTTDLRKLARAMMNNKAPFYKQKISASTGVGTQPIQNAWFMIIGSEVLYDAEALTGWRNIATYPQGQAEENEVGSFGYFRMLLSGQAAVAEDEGAAVGSTGLASTTGTSADVYLNIAFAADAYGVIDCDGGMKTIRKDKTQIGGALELYGTVGWKHRYVAKIIDQDRMYRYECAVSE